MDMEACKRKAVAMLRGYRGNEVCIRMLEADIKALERLESYNCNMAVSYDQPSSGATNKVTSPVETELMQKEQQREKLQKALIQRQARKQRIDLALENMPAEKQLLLQLRYIDGMLWKQVCQHMNYSEEYIRKELNEAAVEILACYLFPELSKVNLFAENF